MKHYLHRAGLFRPLLLMLMLLVGSGGARVWADSYTITFATGTGDGSTASTSTACSSIVSGGGSYLAGNLATATKVYYEGSDGLKLGTSSASGIVKMNLASAVTPTSIVVNAKLYNSTKSATLKVNGSTAQSITADASDLTFAITSEISYIQLETSKYSWIKSITVNYEGGSSGGDSNLTASNLALTNAPVALTFDLYNNSSAQTVSFTTSSTGAVTVSGGTGYVTTSVSGNTITVTPTAVTSGSQTITVHQAADATYAAGSATFTVTIGDSTPFSGGDITFVAGTDKGSTGSNNSPDKVTKSVVTMSCTDAAFATDEYRVYKSSTLTFSTTQGKITNITFTAVSGYSLGSMYQSSGTSYNSETGVWTGNASSVSFTTTAQVRLTQIVVTVELDTPEGTVATPTFSPAAGTYNTTQSVEISCSTAGATIYYTTDGTDPTTSSSVYSSAINVASSQTIKAIAAKEDMTNSAVASATYTINIIPIINADNVELAYNATSGSISPTIENSVDGGVLSASTTAEWLTIGNVGQTVPFTCTANSALAARSATVTLTYTYNTDQTVTKNVTVTQAGDPNAPGTENNPYTVAEAIAAIDANTGITGVYATGIVCTAGSSLSSGALNYWISDDGTETNKFEIYRGKGIDGANFTSTSDIQKGDVVVVYGNLTKYNSTYEFSSGSQLISLTSKPEPELSFSPETATAVLGQPFTGPTLVNPNNLTVTWNSMNTAVATVDDTTGEVTLHAAGGTYIRAVFAGNDQYKPKTVSYELTVEDHTPSIVFDGQQNPLSETFTAGDTNIHYEVSYLSDEVTLVLCDAEGNPATYDWFSATLSGDDSYVAASWQANTDTQNSRTAYFYLQSGNTRSAIFAFTQAVYVVDYATLPFSWDDTNTPNGITKSGVGTYASSPYLKFDGSGDYVILKLGENEVPGTLTYDIMGNSFSGGTFTVQTSQLGVTFTDVKTHTELSGTKTTESIELDGNIRYIKWIYTNKVNGNVALGNIQVGRYVPRTVIDLRTYNPTINVSQGAFRTLLSFTTNSGAPLQLTIDEENTTLGSNDVSVKPNGDAYGEYYVELSDDFYNNVRESGVIVLKANAAAYGEYEAANEVTITVPVTGETFSAEDVNLAYDATSGQIAYSIENPLLYATLSAECDAEWISNIQVANPSAASGTITFTTTPNEGTEPRTATIILKHQYSSIQKEVNVTVTQAGLEIDYETLPFSWEGGGKQALQALNGVTANGLGSDYAADDHAPYLIKLDNTGDYIQVKTDAQPDQVTIGVKMIGGGNTSTITVQESADGETFTDVEALTISGASNDELTLETTNAFAADTRYVRLLFTKGSNVGVGPITITKVTPKGSADNPYTVAEARDMMDITGTEQVLAAVQGYVCEVGTINENTHELAYYIADAVDSNERIHIVAGKYLNGADFTEDNILHVGDFVVVQGYYSKYNGAYDCRRDNTLVSVIPGYTITLGNVENCEIYVFDNDNQNEALVSNDEDNPVSSASVLSGTTIAISAFANQGYGNLSVTVTDGNDQTVELTEPATEGDMYTFTMPAGDVTITATAEEVTSYTVLIDEGEHCTLNVFTDPTSALESGDEVVSGTKIYVSATPDEGFGVPTITVMAGDDELDLTYDEENSAYYFTLEYDVIISAVADEASFYTRTTTITSGKHYIIVGQKDNALYAMGGQNTNNRTAVYVGSAGNRITVNSDVEEFVIYGPYADGNYAIYSEAGEGGYLYAASSSSNYLRTKDVKDANGTWTIEFDATDGFASIVANGSNSRNVMQFNSASTLFACYGGSSQSPVYLYEKVNDVLPEEMAFLSEYGYSTLCCKNPLYFAADDEVSAWKVTAVQGENVTFERLIGIVPSGTGILLKGQGYGEVTLTSARDVSNASIADVSGNLLVGVADPMTIQSGQYYGLYYDSFRKLGAGTVPDNRAILPQSISQSGVKAFTFVFNEGGIATGINELDNWTNYNSTIYNLNGQRLVKPQKGFNIINGKKVLVK